MTRASDPTQGLSYDRFRVWADSADLYAHAELAGNWDTLDAILGKPSDGTAWPPIAERGAGKGLYKLISLLQLEREGIGSFKWVWAPSGSAFSEAAWQARGWEVAKGQTIASGNHSFPGLAGSAIKLPAMYQRTIMGADPTKAYGTAGKPDNTASSAPGIVQFDGVNNVGEGGSNVRAISVTVPAHSHPLSDHAHILPAHAHPDNHKHDLVSPTTGDTRSNYVIYDLADAAISNVYDVPNGWSPGDGVLQSWASKPLVGSQGHWVPHVTHFHALGGADTGNSEYLGTSTQKGATDAAPDLGTTGVVGGAGATEEHAPVTISAPNVDMRPLHVGMVPLIRCRYITSLS